VQLLLDCPSTSQAVCQHIAEVLPAECKQERKTIGAPARLPARSVFGALKQLIFDNAQTFRTLHKTLAKLSCQAEDKPEAAG
jgi:hypothetical protein